MTKIEKIKHFIENNELQTSFLEPMLNDGILGFSWGEEENNIHIIYGVDICTKIISQKMNCGYDEALEYFYNNIDSSYKNIPEETRPILMENI